MEIKDSRKELFREAFNAGYDLCMFDSRGIGSNLIDALRFETWYQQYGVTDPSQQEDMFTLEVTPEQYLIFRDLYTKYDDIENPTPEDARYSHDGITWFRLKIKGEHKIVLVMPHDDRLMIETQRSFESNEEFYKYLKVLGEGLTLFEENLRGFISIDPNEFVMKNEKIKNFEK